MAAPWQDLTTREIVVAEMLVAGKKNREIAEALGGLSTKTIDTHRGHILKKLKVRNNVEALRSDAQSFQRAKAVSK